MPTGVTDATGTAPEEVAAFLDEGAADRSPYLDALRAAGGNKNVQISDHVKGRVNQLTGQLLFRTCAFCGVLDDLKACSNCNSVMYCSKSCQKEHWKEHRASCKLCAYNAKSAFNASKWLNSMPGMVVQLQNATTLGFRLPVVNILVGENERRCHLTVGGCDNQEELEAMKPSYPQFADMFRFDKEDVSCGMSRVLVVVQHKNITTVMRVRV